MIRLNFSYIKSKLNFFGESNLLILNSSKAKKKLKWKQILNFSETIKLTLEWYIKFRKNKYSKIDLITNEQINKYQQIVDKKTQPNSPCCFFEDLS